jgi:polyisoprenoid-binding protein YceI
MNATMNKLTILALAVILGFLWVPATLVAQNRTIDTNHSKLRVYVSKAGLFSAFGGDNHEVEAPISEGLVDESARRVKFIIDSRQMKVLDPQLSPDKRNQVQERMLGPDVLDVARFPQIKFESTSVEQAAPGRMLVRGQLVLHGVTRPVIVNVQTENGHYVGTVAFKQRDFGISPVTIAGGTVKVKNELKIEFDIRTSTQTAVAPK